MQKLRLEKYLAEDRTVYKCAEDISCFFSCSASNLPSIFEWVLLHIGEGTPGGPELGRYVN